jgi:hypothetical protein
MRLPACIWASAQLANMSLCPSLSGRSMPMPMPMPVNIAYSCMVVLISWSDLPPHQPMSRGHNLRDAVSGGGDMNTTATYTQDTPVAAVNVQNQNERPQPRSRAEVYRAGAARRRSTLELALLRLSVQQEEQAAKRNTITNTNVNVNVNINIDAHQRPGVGASGTSMSAVAPRVAPAQPARQHSSTASAHTTLPPTPQAKAVHPSPYSPALPSALTSLPSLPPGWDGALRWKDLVPNRECESWFS